MRRHMGGGRGGAADGGAFSRGSRPLLLRGAHAAVSRKQVVLYSLLFFSLVYLARALRRSLLLGQEGGAQAGAEAVAASLAQTPRFEARGQHQSVGAEMADDATTRLCGDAGGGLFFVEKAGGWTEGFMRVEAVPRENAVAECCSRCAKTKPCNAFAVQTQAEGGRLCHLHELKVPAPPDSNSDSVPARTESPVESAAVLHEEDDPGPNEEDQQQRNLRVNDDDVLPPPPPPPPSALDHGDEMQQPSNVKQRRAFDLDKELDLLLDDEDGAVSTGASPNPEQQHLPPPPPPPSSGNVQFGEDDDHVSKPTTMNTAMTNTAVITSAGDQDEEEEEEEEEEVEEEEKREEHLKPKSENIDDPPEPPPPALVDDDDEEIEHNTRGEIAVSPLDVVVQQKEKQVSVDLQGDDEDEEVEGGEVDNDDNNNIVSGNELASGKDEEEEGEGEEDDDDDDDEEDKKMVPEVHHDSVLDRALKGEDVERVHHQSLDDLLLESEAEGESSDDAFPATSAFLARAEDALSTKSTGGLRPPPTLQQQQQHHQQQQQQQHSQQTQQQAPNNNNRQQQQSTTTTNSNSNNNGLASFTPTKLQPPSSDDVQSNSITDDAVLMGIKTSSELQQSTEVNAKIGAMPIKNIITPGVYGVTILDPVYQARTKFFGRFRAASEIHDFINDWQAEYSKPQPGVRAWQVDTFTLGKTGEDKMIKAVEFGNPNRGKHVFVIAGMRGCDWIGPLALVHTALAMVGRRKSTAALLDSVRFHFVPLLNVDGYHYSRRKSPESARHWCYNRRVTGGGHGVNLERNWGNDGESWGFGKKGKDGRKDKHGFQGLNGFSEPETRAVRDYINSFTTGTGRVAVLHVRCCNGALTPPRPFGERAAKEPQAADAIQQGLSTISQNLRLLGEGNEYTIVKRPDAFSTDNTGQFVDWAYSQGVTHAYSLEVKAVSVATHNDRYQISPEPFSTLAKELEIGVVTVAKLLLQQTIQGPPPAKLNYRPKLAVTVAAVSAPEKSSSASSSSKSKSSGGGKK